MIVRKFLVYIARMRRRKAVKQRCAPGFPRAGSAEPVRAASPSGEGLVVRHRLY